jgi:hypothetical protein
MLVTLILQSADAQTGSFMKRQYAPLDVVLTPMKGYGLRAADNIPSSVVLAKTGIDS